MENNSAEIEFLCPDCGLKCDNPTSLLKHQMRNHKSSKALKLTFGEDKTNNPQTSSFVDEAKLKKQKDVIKDVQCEVCHKFFSNNQGLQRHMVLHDGEKRYKCEICFKTFNFASGYWQHKFTHNPVESKCSYCDKVLSNPRNLRGHELRVHAIRRNRAGRVTEQKELDEKNNGASEIELSNESKTSHQYQSNGISEKTEEKYYVADQMPNQKSPKNLKSPKTLKSHVRKGKHDNSETNNSDAVEADSNKQKQNIKGIQCTVCKKYFTRKRGLQEHMFVHDSKKRYKCEICFKTFTFHASYYMHKYTHNPVASKCRYCDKVLTNPRNRRAHELTMHGKRHSREKKQLPEPSKTIDRRVLEQFPQPLKESKSIDVLFEVKELNENDNSTSVIKLSDEYQCGTSSMDSQDNSKINNLDAIEADCEKQKQMIKSVQCKVCHKYFTNRKCLHQHMYLHKSNKRYKCEICLKTFTFRSSYNSHKFTHNPVESKCRYCDTVLKNPRTRQGHELKMHGKRHSFSEQSKSIDVLFEVKESHENDNSASVIKVSNEYLCGASGTDGQVYQSAIIFPHKEQVDKTYNAGDAIGYDKLAKTLKSDHTEINNLDALEADSKKQKQMIKSVQCKVCHKYFTNRKCLHQHMYLHDSKKRFMCEICFKTFTFRSGYNAHKYTHNPVESKCRYCDKVLKNTRGLREHELNMHGKGPIKVESMVYQCDYCDKSFKEKKTLMEHTIIHTGQKKYQCKICLKYFKYHDTLRVHQFQHNPLICECDICNKVFTNPINLQRHRRKVHKIKTCNNSVTSLRENRHNMLKSGASHKKEMLLKQEQGNWKFVNGSDYFKSNKTATKGAGFKKAFNKGKVYKNVQCKVCRKTFSHINVFYKHKFQQHARSLFKLYKCCYSKTALKLRKRIMHNDIKVNGKATGKSEKQLNSVITDVNDDLSTDNLVQTKTDTVVDAKGVNNKVNIAYKGKHKCLTCGKCFASASSLMVHSRLHSGEEPYECKLCNKRFKFSSSFKVHKYTHMRNVYNCKECGRVLSSPNALKNHMMIVHKKQVTASELKVYMSEDIDSCVCSGCGKSFKGTTRKFSGKEKCEKCMDNDTVSHENWGISNEADRNPANDAETFGYVSVKVEDYANSILTFDNSEGSLTPYNQKQDTVNHSFVDNSISNIEEKTHLCAKCTMLFLTATELFRHIRAHGEDDENDCVLCKRVFETDDMLKSHVHECHNLNRQNSSGEIINIYAQNAVTDTDTTVLKSKQLSTSDNMGNSYKDDEIADTISNEAHLDWENHVQTGIDLNSISTKNISDIEDIHCENDEEDCEDYEHVSAGVISDFAVMKESYEFGNLIDNASHSNGVQSIQNTSLVESNDIKHDKSSFALEIMETGLQNLPESSNFESKEDVLDTLTSLGGDGWVTDSELTEQCLICGKYFLDAYCLRQHCRKAHKSLKSIKNLKSIKKSRDKKKLVPNKSVQCDICNLTFSSYRTLKVHIRIHTGETPHKCFYCEQKFRFLSLLYGHIKRYHSDIKYNCRICKDLLFDDLQSFRHHIMTVHSWSSNDATGFLKTGNMALDENSYLNLPAKNKYVADYKKGRVKCNVCSLVSKSESILKIHMRIHSEKPSHVCQKCNRRFHNLIALHRHKRGHVKAKPFNTVSCKICGENYRNMRHFHNHMQVKHQQAVDIKSFKCKYCELIFTAKSCLSLHMKTHQNIRRYQCAHCSRSFQLLTKYKLHTAQHFANSKRKFLCKICGYNGGSKFGLFRHKIKAHTIYGQEFKQEELLNSNEIHDNEKSNHGNFAEGTVIDNFRDLLNETVTYLKEKSSHRSYICPRCDMCFTKPLYLLDHIKLHDGKGYNCVLCNIPMISMSVLKNHTKEHQVKHDKRSTIISISCTFCEKEFTSKKSNISNLKYHMLMHSRMRNYKCDECGQKFTKRQGRRKHALKQHSTQLYDCRFCNHALTSIPTLHKHVKENHCDQYQKRSEMQELRKPYVQVKNSSSCQTIHDLPNGKVVEPIEKVVTETRVKAVGSLANISNNHSVVCEENIEKKHGSEKKNIMSDKLTDTTALKIELSQEYIQGTKLKGEQNYTISYENLVKKALENVQQKRIKIPLKKLSLEDLTVLKTSRLDVRTKLSESTEKLEHQIESNTSTMPESQNEDFRMVETTENTQNQDVKDEKRCIICYKTIEENMQDHLQIHISGNTGGEFKCELCYVKFEYSDSLKSHKEVHKKQKSLYTCVVCCNDYKSTRALIVHMRKHTGEKPYVCLICHDGFERRLELDLHTYTHLGIKGYRCDQCGKSYKCDTGLRVHFLSKNNGCFNPAFKRRVSCKKCKKWFQKESSLTNHVCLRVKKLKCEYCNNELSSKKALQIHISTQHTKETPYKCLVCNMKFSTHRQLSFIHMYTHTHPKGFKCEICSNVYPNPMTLKEHMGDSHSDIPRKQIYKPPSTEYAFKCAYENCDKAYKDNRSLKVHYRVHTGENPYKCPTCGESFRYYAVLESHKVKHINIPPHQCSECGKCFTTRAGLWSHIRHKHQGMPHKPESKVKVGCEICGKKVARGNYKAHQAQHTGVKAHVCDICGKGFAAKTTLKAHKLTHLSDEDKPYHCAVCRRAFALKNNLAEHMKTHTGDKPHTCDVCGMTFARLNTLTNHMRRHTGEKPFKCSFCGRAFSLYIVLVTHVRTHTGVKPYSCTECGKKFIDRSGLKSHKKTHK